ncbi:MAG: hypothetical protein ACRDJI_04445, partial [Actinomycetota bacterium]
MARHSWKIPPSASGEEYTTASIYRRLFALARPYRPRFVVIIILSLLASPIALLTPLPLKIAFDNVLRSRPLPGLLDAVVPGSGLLSDGQLIVLVAVLVRVIALVTQLQLFSSWFLQS